MVAYIVSLMLALFPECSLLRTGKVVFSTFGITINLNLISYPCMLVWYQVRNVELAHSTLRFPFFVIDLNASVHNPCEHCLVLLCREDQIHERVLDSTHSLENHV